jgi:hypothetical protein
MQCLTGTRAGTRPPLRLASDAVAEASLVPAELERVAARLGLASSDQNGERVGPNAYYSPRMAAIVWPRVDIPTDDEQAMLTLGHEYVHAIQDRGHALRDLLDTRARRSFDQELALFGLREGQAALYEELLRALVQGRAPAAAARARFASITSLNDDAMLRQRRPLWASFASFPYTYGANWAASRWLEAGELLMDGTPPSSSREIMATRYGWPAAAFRACPSASSERLGPAWKRVASDTLGAFIMQTYVRVRTRDAERAHRAARDWRGDSITAYVETAAGREGFSWRTCWPSPEVAREMAALIEEQLKERSAGTLAVTIEANDVLATALDG